MLSDRPTARRPRGRPRASACRAARPCPHAGRPRGDSNACSPPPIDRHAPALIALAGFMRILSPDFVARYAGKIMNIHPSLLPKYPGLHTHRRALEARRCRARRDGAFRDRASSTAARPSCRRRVAVQPQDDEDTLAARVLAAEHRIYPLAVSWFCEGRLRFADGRAWLDGSWLRSPMQIDVARPCGAAACG